MAQLMQPFDAHNVDPTQGVGGLPIGKHPVIACKSEVKPTQDGGSGYLQYDLQVIDGPNKSAVGAYRLNLYHSNPVTCEIAHKQLSAMCHVTGVYQVQDSSQLHNIPFIVEVGLQKEPNPNKYTEVKRVFDINGNEPGHANGNGQAAQNTGNSQPQNQQPQGGAGWGGNSTVANNAPMPDNNNNNNNNNNNAPSNGGQPAWGQNNNAPVNNTPANNAPSWGQNNNAPANNGQPAWGQR